MIPRCKECQHCELRNRAESKFTGGYGYGRGYFFCRKSRNKEVAERSFWKSDAEFYRIRHTRIRNEADGEDKPKMVSKEEEKRMKQDSAGQFSQCNRCGARIMWVKTKAGKNMPVDPQFVDFKKIKGGKERLVLPNGEVVAGERCKAERSGWLRLHFSFCDLPWLQEVEDVT